MKAQHSKIINFIRYSFLDFYDQKNVTTLIEHDKKDYSEDILKTVERQHDK